jgi:hypothetical protein
MCTRGSPSPPHYGCFSPAQELFILYDLRGWMVSFCTVSISSASSSWSNTWHRSMTNDSWIFCHRWARKIWMSEIFRVGICSSQRGEENRTEHHLCHVAALADTEADRRPGKRACTANVPCHA